MEEQRVMSGLYRDHDGGEYCIHGLATHSETGEVLVIYISTGDGAAWACPLWRFLEQVDGRPRFERNWSAAFDEFPVAWE